MNTSTEHDPHCEPSRRPPFWVSPAGARIALIALHVAALAAVLAEYLYPFSDDAHGVERISALDFTASYALYGFAACVILVLLGRVLRSVVMRGEDYYDGGR